MEILLYLPMIFNGIMGLLVGAFIIGYIIWELIKWIRSISGSFWDKIVTFSINTIGFIVGLVVLILGLYVIAIFQYIIFNPITLFLALILLPVIGLLSNKRKVNNAGGRDQINVAKE